MPDGTTPTYRIPALLKLDERSEHGKKTKCIFAISVAYLQRRLGVVLADGRHVREEVMRELYGGGANASISPDVHAALVQLIDTPLAQRLEIQTIPLREALLPSFIERLSQCDIMREPIAHALRLTFENATLGKTSPYSRSTWANEDNLLVHTQPRDIRIEVPLKERHKTVVQYLPLGWMMQRLHIVRRDDVPPFVFTNGNRARAIGRDMLDRTLAPYVASIESSSYLQWAKSSAFYCSFDIDMHSSLHCLASIGRAVGIAAPDEYYSELQQAARYQEWDALGLGEGVPDLRSIPHTFPPLARRLAQFAWLKDHKYATPAELDDFLATKAFPQECLRTEITELVNRVLGPRSGRYDGITAAHTVMLRHLPPAWKEEEEAAALRERAAAEGDAMDLDVV